MTGGALVCEPAAEYVAQNELRRLDLNAYLPEYRRKWQPPRWSSAALPTRRYPLFPRYLLIQIRHIDHELLRACRGLCRFKPVLANAEGKPWRCPDRVIDAMKESEARGDFDTTFAKGDRIQLAKGVLAGVEAVLAATARSGRVEILMPLFGTLVKATAPQGDIARL